MPVIEAEFDGRAFVPAGPVDLPVGSRVEVVVPPPKPTPEQEREWNQLVKDLSATEPAFPSADEALRYTRKRP